MSFLVQHRGYLPREQSWRISLVVLRCVCLDYPCLNVTHFELDGYSRPPAVENYVFYISRFFRSHSSPEDISASLSDNNGEDTRVEKDNCSPCRLAGT